MSNNDEASLLNEWRNQRPEYQDFVFDGILNKAIFDESNPKIAILLKESNDDFTQIAPLKVEGYGPTGNSNLFWRHINIYVFIATCAWNNRESNYMDIKEITEKKVNSIAYINIKKNAQSKNVSDQNDILNYAKKDKIYLQRQIDLIGPQVIFCGNTKRSYDEIEKTKQISNNVYLGNNKIVIDYYHPSYTIGYENCVKDLTNMLFDPKVQDEIIKIKSNLIG